MKPLWIAGLTGLAVIVALLMLRPTPPAAEGPAAPAAAEPLPMAASAASGVAAASVPAATAAASMPPVVTTPRARQVGPEGYGPYIDRAQAGQDPKAAWEAVQWLRQCINNEARRTSFELMRNRGVSPEMMTQLMVEADAEARRCQTVTAAHRALLPELASRAMRAGLPEAASAYAASAFPGDLTAEQRQEVAQAMRRDAQTGDLPSLLGALTANDAWGLTDEERLNYLVAYAAIGGSSTQAMAKALVESNQIRFRSRPTPEQLQAAMRNARPWLERLRAEGKVPVPGP
jgi:hypothetical protein